MTDYHLLRSLSQAVERNSDAGEEGHDSKQLLRVLLADEIFRVHTWLYPLTNENSVNPVNLDATNEIFLVRLAWKLDPYLAIHLSERFTSSFIQREVRRLVLANPADVTESPLGAEILLRDALSPDIQYQLKVNNY